MPKVVPAKWASFRSIDEEDVNERILRHLGLWQEENAVHCGTDEPGEMIRDPWLDGPFPKKPVFDFRNHFCYSHGMEVGAFGFTFRTKAPEG